MINTKNLFASAFAMAVSVLTPAMAMTVVNPSVKTPTSFAIIVDSKSYDNARQEIDAYRAAVESDGLGTYLVVDDWQRPEPIREILMKLHADKKSPLEGCVLVGDIPIPMVRDAHHLSSAFKMDPKADWRKSSIPSDRYYDDFGLTFDYIKQDSVKADYHYVSLRPDCKQYIAPDIYSARIRPLHLDGKDRYEMLRKFMRKAVAEKQSGNRLDNLTMARGHGYNSEDDLAWAGEQMALREQIPSLFRPGATVKFYDFDTREPAKPLYLNEVGRDDLDIMLFHHHGGPTMQYLSGIEKVSATSQCIETIKRFLRGKVAKKAAKVGREKAMEEYAKTYDVPMSWVAEAFDSVKVAADSVADRLMDIYTDDIREVNPNARFVLLDACYNGSFHLDDNVAGSYIFSDGKTQAALGCTVNTIQDKWPDEFLGLMAQGMRIGQFVRFTCFLENHLSGDPTLRFASDAKDDVNRILVLKEGDTAFWLKQFNSPQSSPDMKAMALRQLSMAGYAALPALLKDAYLNSDSFVVRLEALRLLALNYPAESAEYIAMAMNDSYELIRRFATEYAELNSDPALIKAWADASLGRGYENRMRFRLQSGIDAFDHDQLSAEVKSRVDAAGLYNSDLDNQMLKAIKRSKGALAESISDVSSAETVKKKLSAVSPFRNKPVTPAVPVLVALVADGNADEEVRVAAAEALGWYNIHFDRASIASQLADLGDTGSEKVNREVQKTINRLSGKNR